MSENARTFAVIRGARVVDLILSRADVPGAIDITDAHPVPAIGWHFDGESFTPPPAFSRDEAAIKREAIARVNAGAGAFRAQFVTDVPGQAETYLLKADELRAYDESSGTLDPIFLPILSAEASATGMSLSAVADLVRATRAQWVLLAAAIEGKRRGAIVAIENATTESDAWSAVPEVWP